jgi:enoyl-[acyl-carrier protein] reductase I
VLPGFLKQLNTPEGYGKDQLLSNGTKMEFHKIYPLDLSFSNPAEVPEKTKSSKYYKDLTAGFDIKSVAEQVTKDYGKIDYFVHSVANGPEVTKPLLETSRAGYLAASSASAYSLVSAVQEFGPIMNPGGAVLSISYIAAEKVVPGYGGGMSSAKAQLESDTRTLAFEAGRAYGVRVNSISAGPLKSRAASAIGRGLGSEKVHIDFTIDYMKANAPLSDTDLYAEDVGTSALGLLAPHISRAVTGTVLHVDNGMHIMGISLDSKAFDDSPTFKAFRAKKTPASDWTHP